MKWRSAESKTAAAAVPARPRRRTASAMGALVLILGVAAGVGWYATRWLDRPDGEVDESSGSLASNIIDRAWEIGTVFAESAQRDMARIGELLRRSDEEEEDESVEAVDELARAVAPPPAPADTRPPPPRIARPSPVFLDVPRVAAEGPVLDAPLELPPLLGVFDGNDPGVVPPGVSAIRHRDLASDDVWAESALVEVIVSPEGLVERSRLISVPHDVHESMILSAIKSWRFDPATKDGHPVRYRLLMPVDVAR